MSLSPIAELSQELVDEIVDTLARLSPRPTHGWWEPPHPWVDLNACALVCRSFLARAQVHIFRVIAIKDDRTPNRDHKLSLLQDALEHNPGLVNHIRELELANSNTGFIWALQHARLLPILHLVDQARQGFEKLTFRVVGGSFSLSVQDTASEIFKVVGTQITSLSIHFFEDFGQVHPRILTHLPHLTELSLRNVLLFPPGALPTPGVHLHYPKLQVLDFDSSPDFVACLSSSECAADLSQLRILKARLISRDDALQVQAVVDIAFKSLRALDLTFLHKRHYDMSALEGVIKLERCRSLRLLEITVPFFDSTVSTAIITSTLQSLPDKSENTLRELHLTLIHSSYIPKKQDVLGAPWAAVGDEIRRMGGGEAFLFDMHYLEDPVPVFWDDIVTAEDPGEDESYLRSDEDCQEALLAIRRKIEDRLGDAMHD